MIIFELVCFVQKEPAGQSGPGDSATIIQNERRSIDLPPRINPYSATQGPFSAF